MGNRKWRRRPVLSLTLGIGMGIGLLLLAGQGLGFSGILDYEDGLQGAFNDEDLSAPAAIQLGSEISSRQAILVDLESGRVICEKSSAGRAYPASLTKIMTAIVAIENLSDLNKKIRLPESLFNDLYEEDASLAGFLPGEKVRAIDLLYGLMLPSGAEAAAGLARDISGSEAEFVRLMNRKAEELGMENTHFTNISGIHDSDHYTTVEDMAILLEYALQNEVFHDIFTCEYYSTARTNLHPDGISFSSTLFQGLESPRIKGGAIIGGKTGYTKEAGLCLASLAEKGEKRYILVTTGAPGDHKGEQYNITDAFYIYNLYLDS